MQNISKFQNVFVRKIFLSFAESLFYILSENFFFPFPVSVSFSAVFLFNTFLYVTVRKKFLLFSVRAEIFIPKSNSFLSLTNP